MNRGSCAMRAISLTFPSASARDWAVSSATFMSDEVYVGLPAESGLDLARSCATSPHVVSSPGTPVIALIIRMHKNNSSEGVPIAHMRVLRSEMVELVLESFSVGE